MEKFEKNIYVYCDYCNIIFIGSFIFIKLYNLKQSLFNVVFNDSIIFSKFSIDFKDK